MSATPYPVYSPLPAEDYVLATQDNCEVRAVMKLAPPMAAAVWNLFWLSYPMLDALPLAGSRWSQRYQPLFAHVGEQRKALVSQVVEDVYNDVALCTRLHAAPASFVAWWAGEDPSIYETAGVAGPGWHATVLHRARAAARWARPATVRCREGRLEVLLGSRRLMPRA